MDSGFPTSSENIFKSVFNIPYCEFHFLFFSNYYEVNVINFKANVLHKLFFIFV
jgi:hypothetical protein